jgi:hypothetical protein
MEPKVQYEKIRVCFDYSGKEYSGEIVCSNLEATHYWFVFDNGADNPLGGSIEFRTLNGHLRAVQEFPGHEMLIACIKTVINKHFKEICH